MLSLKYCHFVFIKSYHLLLQKESQETNLCFPKKNQKEEKTNGFIPSKALCSWLHLAPRACLFPHPPSSLVSTACPRLCELTLHRKDVTCDGQDYYVCIFWNAFPVQPAKSNRLLQWSYKGKHSHRDSCNTLPRKSILRGALGEDTLSSPSGSVCLTHTLPWQREERWRKTRFRQEN